MTYHLNKAQFEKSLTTKGNVIRGFRANTIIVDEFMFTSREQHMRAENESLAKHLLSLQSERQSLLSILT